MNRKIRILATIVILFFASASTQVYAQPHPDGQSNGSATGGAPIAGASAPVGSGMMILLTLAAAYGGTKVYGKRNNQADLV
ncbi:MAG: hypothetical protein WCI92_02150 [Bacteroidota bacterium]